MYYIHKMKYADQIKFDVVHSKKNVIIYIVISILYFRRFWKICICSANYIFEKTKMYLIILKKKGINAFDLGVSFALHKFSNHFSWNVVGFPTFFVLKGNNFETCSVGGARWSEACRRNRRSAGVSPRRGCQKNLSKVPKAPPKGTKSYKRYQNFI